MISSAAGVTPGSNCFAESQTTVTCESFGAGTLADDFTASLGAGDDQLRFSGDFHGSRIFPRIGDDQIFGGIARDVIVDEGGNDRLRGRDGNDYIEAGTGSDSVAGGSGNDRLHAEDGEADRKIVCGPGHDVAHIDLSLDPQPVGCERVAAGD